MMYEGHVSKWGAVPHRFVVKVNGPQSSALCDVRTPAGQKRGGEDCLTVLS